MEHDHSTNANPDMQNVRNVGESQSDPVAQSTDESLARTEVTVAITSFNHEQYIEQAITSVLDQRTEFRIEILVADDCSTDRTADVIERLSDTNPGRLTILSRPHNLGVSANMQDCRDRARGKYLAILEGDDFWTDPLKLQKQYDAMQANPQWSMCFTACRVVHAEMKQKDFVKPDPFPQRPLTFDDFLAENQIQTMSVAMYRQGIVERTPQWHAQIRIGDWALNMLHAKSGPIGFVPQVCAHYRVHSEGLWSGLSSFGRWQEIDTLFSALEQHFERELRAKIAKARQNFKNDFDDRVAYLERIERRYQAFGLEWAARAKLRLKRRFDW